MKLHFVLPTAVVAMMNVCAAGVAADKPDVERARAERNAAKKAFELHLAYYNTSGRTNFPAEKLYVWSRRWMQGEQRLTPDRTGRLAAAEAHLARMTQLERVVKLNFKAGLAISADVAAAEYYRLRAADAVARARGK